MRRAFGLLGLLLAWPCAAAMQLGVNTHFDQGWPLSAFEQVRLAGAPAIRDALGWGKVERAPGTYAFTAQNSGYLDQACRQGLAVSLTLTPRSPLYDSGETVYSETGRRAFARFASAVVDRFPCVRALEIGNEINDHALTGRMRAAMPQSYMAILAALDAELGTRRSRVSLLAGSTLSVATGFLERLFAAGALRHVDAVAVHPYVAVPEQLPAQIARLRSIMARAGTERPIVASEFSYSLPSADQTPAYALKMVALLSAAHVQRADWYALREESWFPNAGLFGNGAPRPALATFQLAQARLLAAGEAVRVDFGDPYAFVYRFGPGPYVAWGAGQAIRVNGAATARDARGQAIPLPARLGPDPVMLDAPGGLSLGPATLLADSMIGMGSQGFRYAVEANAASTPLDWVDWNWTPYLGAAAFPAFKVLPNGVAIGGQPKGARQLVERLRSPATGQAWLAICLAARSDKPVEVTIRANRRILYSAVVAGIVQPAAFRLTGEEAQAVELRYGVARSAGPRFLRRRVALFAGSEAASVACPAADRDRGAPAAD